MTALTGIIPQLYIEKEVVLMNKKAKMIARISAWVFFLFGFGVFAYSNIVSPLKYKYPLGFGAFLTALIISKLFTYNEKMKASKIIFAGDIILIVCMLILTAVSFLRV